MAAIGKKTVEDAVSSVKICKLKAVQHLLMQLRLDKFKGKTLADCMPALLKRAAQASTLQVFTYLVEHENADISHPYGDQQLYVIHIAAFSGQLEIVRYLIDRDKTVLQQCDASGRTPLLHACRGGHAPVISWLLKAGANIQHLDDRGGTALHYCSFHGHLHCLQVLLLAGADPNIQTISQRAAPSHLAAQQGHLLCLEALETAGVDMNCVDVRGWTPLHHACVGGAVKCVDYLVKDQAVLRAVSIDHLSGPLHLAAWKGHVPCISSLIEAGVDPTKANKFGVTALHFSAHSGEMQCVQYLLKLAPSLLHTLTTTGQLPIHKAAHGGHVDVLKALIEAGSHPYSKDNQGKTPAVIASERGHSHCVEYLIASCTESIRSPQSESSGGALMHNIPMPENSFSPHFALDEELDSEDLHWLVGELYMVRTELREVKQELTECQKSNEHLKKFNVKLMKETKQQGLKNAVLQVDKERLTLSLTGFHAGINHRSPPVSELDILTISRHVGKKWRFVARRLGLTEAEIENMAADNFGDQREQGYQAVVRWMKKEGSAATREILLAALEKEGFALDH